MSKNGRIAIIYDEIPSDASPDEKDILVEVEAVSNALRNLGFTTEKLEFSFDMGEFTKKLDEMSLLILFNLVESVKNNGRFIHIPILLFEHLNMRYTGVGSEAMYLTSNKVITKKILTLHTIPTPPWQTLSEIVTHGIQILPPFIIKPIGEDASVEIDDNAIFYDRDSLINRIGHICWCDQNNYVVEKYITGREISVSILENKNEPQILPPAEILFQEYPEGKPHIVGYDAKWRTESFEYTHTKRTFSFSKEDTALIEKITAIAATCWEIFQLKGYARIDFRVDEQYIPWVLEINANPCISPDSGFTAAALQAGITPYEKIISRIISSAMCYA